MYTPYRKNLILEASIKMLVLLLFIINSSYSKFSLIPNTILLSEFESKLSNLIFDKLFIKTGVIALEVLSSAITLLGLFELIIIIFWQKIFAEKITKSSTIIFLEL